MKRLPHAGAVSLDVCAHLEVLQHRHLGKHDAPLGHVGESPSEDEVGAQPRDVVLVEDHAPRARREESHDGLEGGRLARAVGADDADDLAAAHVERDVMQDVDLAVPGGQMLRDEDGRRHGVARFSQT
jgi:hypothetical protein